MSNIHYPNTIPHYNDIQSLPTHIKKQAEEFNEYWRIHWNGNSRQTQHYSIPISATASWGTYSNCSYAFTASK